MSNKTETFYGEKMSLSSLEMVANHVLYYGCRLNDVGLFHGRTGIAYALLKFSIRNNDLVLNKLALDILETVYDMISEKLPFGIEDGIAGIGYALTELYGIGLLSGDIDSCLSEIDNYIMSIAPKRYMDLSYRTGLLGIWSYIKLRQKLNKENIFTLEFLNEMNESLFNFDLKKYESTKFIEYLNVPGKGRTLSEIPVFLSGGSAYYLVS